MKNLYLTAQLQITGWNAGLPTYSIAVLAANGELQGAELVNQQTDSFSIVASNPNPALGGLGTFLSASDAISWFLSQWSDAIVASANDWAGTTYYQYGGYKSLPIAPQ